MTKKVNLFIIGAAKSGTTSLWSAFASHPEIFVTKDELHKEPSYFSLYGDKVGLDAYQSLYIDHDEQPYLCDASTAYLTSPESAQRIYNYNPKAKIIVILRDPVARAYSLYNWMVADGYEYAKSFEEALGLEDSRFKKGQTGFLMPQYFWNYMYYRSGCYLRQIERYINRFGNNNVLVLSFNELVSSPDLMFSRVCGFLKVDKIPIDFPKENSSVGVYCPSLTFSARKLTSSTLKIIPNSLVNSKGKRDFLVKMTQKSIKPKPIEIATRDSLLNRYEKELTSIEGMFNINLMGSY